MPNHNVESREEAIERFRLANDKKTFDKRMVDETNLGVQMNKPPAGQIPGSSVISKEGVAQPQNLSTEDMSFFDAIKSGNAERAQALLDSGDFVSGVMPAALEADEFRSRSNRQLGVAESSKFADAAKALEDKRQGIDIGKMQSDVALSEGKLAEQVKAGEASRQLGRDTLRETSRLNSARIDQVKATIDKMGSEQILAAGGELALIGQEVVDRELALIKEAQRSGDEKAISESIKRIKDINSMMRNQGILIQKDMEKYILNRLEE